MWCAVLLWLAGCDGWSLVRWPAGDRKANQWSASRAIYELNEARWMSCVGDAAVTAAAAAVANCSVVYQYLFRPLSPALVVVTT